jgi:hypothetical protein
MTIGIFKEWLVKYFFVHKMDLLYLAITNFYTSIVHNTGIKICSSIVYHYCTSIVI